MREEWERMGERRESVEDSGKRKVGGEVGEAGQRAWAGRVREC